MNIYLHASCSEQKKALSLAVSVWVCVYWSEIDVTWHDEYVSWLIPEVIEIFGDILPRPGTMRADLVFLYGGILTRHPCMWEISTRHAANGVRMSLYFSDRGCCVDPQCGQQILWQLKVNGHMEVTQLIKLYFVLFLATYLVTFSTPMQVGSHSIRGAV